MYTALLAGYIAATAAPFLYRVAPRLASWLCTAVPLALFTFFAVVAATGGGGGTAAYSWVPSLGVDATFTLDGLSLIFSLLITGVGSLVIFYAADYIGDQDRHRLGRLYALLLAFMASMLGLVLAANLVLLYVFWELTSITSYLLIAFDHHREEARASALQALLVTGAGGLALLAGVLLLGYLGQTLEIPALALKSELLKQHSLYPLVLLLVLAGAFTKSAQFPFHFWLPSAMVAPTPVSAYLHSAAMVKAGLYLLARLTPVLGGTEWWHHAVTTAGVTTMLLGAVMALPQDDLKRLLAYSTVSALGTLTLLLGVGTSEAMKAFVVFLLVHVLYKSALFLVAGAIEHATGTRELSRLRSLWRTLPGVTLAALLAAFSMAGLPPMIGFIGKELLYEAKLKAPQAAFFITSSGVMANVAMVAVALLVGYLPFFGKGRGSPPRPPHPVSWRLWLGPLFPAALGTLVGLFPGLVDHLLIAPATGAIRAETTTVKLKMWHGVNEVLLLGVLTVVAGTVLYAARGKLLARFPVQSLRRLPGPERCYQLLVEGLLAGARLQTRILQNGYLRNYLKVALAVVAGLVLLALLRLGQLPRLGSMQDLYLHEWLVIGVMLAGAATAATTRSRLAAVTALGAVGYGVGLTYLLFGAPDLAITQFCIETLTVILFVLALYRLPRLSPTPSRRRLLRDALMALGSGGVLSLLALLALSQPLDFQVSDFFAQNSQPLAHGRNVVNVILVDFRGLDTLGEITVLAVAAIGVFALVKIGSARE